MFFNKNAMKLEINDKIILIRLKIKKYRYKSVHQRKCHNRTRKYFELKSDKNSMYQICGMLLMWCLEICSFKGVYLKR